MLPAPIGIENAAARNDWRNESAKPCLGEGKPGRQCGGSQNKELIGLCGRIRLSDSSNFGSNPTQDESLLAADVQARVRGIKFCQVDCA